VICFAIGATAQRQQSLNLTLLTTSIQTQHDVLTLQKQPVQVFPVLPVTCPATATNGCTLLIGISISASYTAQSGGFSQMLGASVTGAVLPPIDPAQLVNLDSIPIEKYRSAWGFEWMQRDVPAGASVAVRVQAGGASGTAGNRTETVQVYQQ
jgi:hypothetical protein